MEKIFIKTTKSSLTHFGKENYSIPLMLSEFIDNSISSWETNPQRNNGEDLLIEIIFDASLEKLLNNNENEGTKKYKIWIKDNANGMNYYELKKAAEFYDSYDKGSEDLNQHGIGLKSAIGWFGTDAIIYSKTIHEEKINRLTLNTKNFKENEEWFLSLDNDLVFDSTIVNNPGTTILIENINNPEEKFDELSEKKIENLLVFLGWKYKYYLNKKVGIKIVNQNSDPNYETKNYCVGPFNIKPWNLEDFYEVIRKKLIKRVNEFDFEEKFKNCKKIFESNIKKIINESDATSLKFKICSKILSNEPILVKKEIEIESKNYWLEVGIISSSSKKYDVGFFKENINKEFGFNQLENKYTFDELQGVSLFITTEVLI